MTPNTAPPPSIQRHRPIDATGLFWSMVLMLMGLFYCGIYSVAFGSLFLIASLFHIRWQFKKWSFDAAVNHLATEWCRTHYPSYGGTPIVDFMVAVGHDTCCDFGQLTPSTALDDLNRIRGNDTLFDNRKEMLKYVVQDARIQRVDWTEFSGSTLDDAIQFIFQHDSVVGPPIL